MQISRYLMLRVGALGLVILVAALALALWRAQVDVRREEVGAAESARLFERLYALENGPRAEVEANLAALARIAASDDLRHVRLELRDALGHVLVAPREAPPRNGLQRAFAHLVPGVRDRREASGPWTLRRDDGRIYVATVTLDPASEQDEAFGNLLGLLGLLAGFALAVLLALYWALKRALAPLQAILAAIARYERNDFAYRLPPQRLRETDAIARALNHLAAALGQAQEQRRRLSLKLLTSQEDERARIARELHDEFGQALTAMRADALWLTRRTEGQPELQKVAREFAGHGERLHLGVRGLLRELRPRAVRAPLRRLLEELVASWRERPEQVARIELVCDVDESRLGDELGLTLYRLTQEALTNAMRHAQATRIRIGLRAGGAGAVEWIYEDDGVGIESTEGAAQRGNGLAGMRERVWAHGGDLRIESARAHATRPGLRLFARFDGDAQVPPSR